jgi:hypothetical protein
LVNTVNTVGIMGKGIALEFKRRFPDMFRDYEERCKAHRVRVGEPYLYTRDSPPWIINFPTKDHWRSVSRLSDIDTGLRYLSEHVISWGVESLAVPPLGCGNGQLEWRVVGPTIRRHLENLPIPVELYAPLDVPPYQATLDFITSAPAAPNGDSLRLRPEWLAIAAVVDRIGLNPYTWPIGRTRMQKVAYFLTAEGVPTALTFDKGSYGPFARDLKQVLSRMVNNGVLSETQQGQMFRVLPGATWPDARAAYEDDLARYESAIARVADLMARLDDKRSEVVAAVHFSARALQQDSDSPPSELEVLQAVMDWKVRRRPPLEEGEVAEAIRSMSSLGWIGVRTSSALPIDENVLVVA